MQNLTESLQSSEDRLFAEWARGRADFIRDGIVDHGRFTSSEPRIVVVLKETNETLPEYGNSLVRYLADGARWQTWNNVARWVRVLSESARDWQHTDLTTISADQRRDALRRIAVMNVKKTAGGRASSRSTLQKAAQADAAWLGRQLEIYQPDIVIDGSGASWCIPQLSGDWNVSLAGVPYKPFRCGGHVGVAIGTTHPAARRRWDESAFRLLETWRHHAPGDAAPPRETTSTVS